MTGRDTQDVIIRLLADAPFRARALAAQEGAPDMTAGILSKVDARGLDRFGRFLARHFYRERVVHYFKYSRALVRFTGRAPEAALKLPEFNALMPQLVIGSRASAEAVVTILKRHLFEDADSIRAAVPYWNDLVAYQSAFFVSDALPAESSGPRRFAARAESATLIELEYDLPSVLPALLRPFDQIPTAASKPTRLLFARSPHGEVTAVRCSDALKTMLDGLTGDVDPAEIVQRMGLDRAAFDKALRQLADLGAIIAQETFSSSHVGSDLPLTK